ncbi:type 1 glutamine amidotransferase domain-containing protein [Uliginosibacterium sp. H1]|uniref:type 1 glutamine amidotransferase domain-containing protein n=1 Tax=Uliginosibacterium sp. H1 TaxID=3114757 RepID=UPI002E16B7C1|nr:type 1 glutamine amidotransferase domain-containing protein [Uliginosibacterium sp. H1]
MKQLQTSGLTGKRVAVLMTDGVEQVEYTGPREFLERHGAKVTLVSPKPAGEEVQGFRHLKPADRFRVEKNLGDASAADFDALVLPGGVANPDQLRLEPDALSFIRDFAEQDKTIAAICHGPWPLIDAGVVAGKRVTSWLSLQQDLRNAGAQWTDESVVVDGKLVTSRKPDDIPAFDQALLESLGGRSTKPAPVEKHSVSERVNNVQEAPGAQHSG